jgi:hypothetical protein
MAQIQKANSPYLMANGNIMPSKIVGVKERPVYTLGVPGVDRRDLVLSMDENEAAQLLEWLIG